LVIRIRLVQIKVRVMQRFTPPQPRLKIPELFTQQIYGQVSAGTGMSCNYHALTNFSNV
jgi:hypothetical protein